MGLFQAPSFFAFSPLEAANSSEQRSSPPTRHCISCPDSYSPPPQLQAVDRALAAVEGHIAEAEAKLAGAAAPRPFESPAYLLAEKAELRTKELLLRREKLALLQLLLPPAATEGSGVPAHGWRRTIWECCVVSRGNAMGSMPRSAIAAFSSIWHSTHLCSFVLR